MDAIGADASHEGEQPALAPFAGRQPTMSEKLERTFVALDHDQRFADFTIVSQLKLIMCDRHWILPLRCW